MSAQAQSQKVRRFILTGAVASITATGAWYGASLKSDRQVSKVCSTPACQPLTDHYHR